MKFNSLQVDDLHVNVFCYMTYNTVIFNINYFSLSQYLLLSTKYCVSHEHTNVTNLYICIGTQRPVLEYTLLFLSTRIVCL